MQPLTGELSDIFGREVSSIFATFLFTIGSLLRRFSTSHEMISLGRVITGVIGGGCTSIAMFIFADRMLPGYKGIWHSVSIYGLTIAGSIILVVDLYVRAAWYPLTCARLCGYWIHLRLMHQKLQVIQVIPSLVECTLRCKYR
ncbi:hypothetical protein F9C07_2281749 [Aspergillus flavus]|uniref:Major facilitator superfamily (MFS) profile domain-containing protein n=1 Tax=Aspergillus flavus (strain ATCC 200026 / FGSC A1120 / IAM 13836 / NRRL 3357 / JCM 12722 / SRRC 167) TaxID=332952 RepID=A0A7U2ML47_ASPFN|nr:hypothetical protein F9C07_2281749 [Aspergillus flavus]